jgi:GNAT superfamily N-acetyltransferase
VKLPSHSRLQSVRDTIWRRAPMLRSSHGGCGSQRAPIRWTSRTKVVVKIDLAESDADIVACFAAIRHLRDLPDAATFLRRVRSQQLSGYRLAALRDGGDPVAVAGFRLGESLAWGRYLYVDDLVTLPEARSRGYGAALLAWLADFARAQGAEQLHLDSGKQRVDAHRFYEREGLEASSIHFRRSL